ncbi:anthrone oxygenase family protein [Brachybacterium huguangmaarense]
MDSLHTDPLLLTVLLVTGFVGCAEFASVALVHPVIRRLPEPSQVLMESGLLTTFGRVMPVGMTAAAVLAGIGAARYQPLAFTLAVVVLTIALIVTIIGNVPINRWQSRVEGDDVPDGFIARRRRWDLFQAIRGSLQLLGFVLVAFGTASL